MKKIILLLALSFVAFSCSDDTTGQDGDSGNGPKEPELLYFASAKVDGKSLNIEYYLDDEPGDDYTPYPGHKTTGDKTDPNFTSYRGGLMPTGLDTSKPMIEVHFQDFVKEAGIDDYRNDYKQLKKIFYKGEFPIAETDAGYGIRVVYGINGIEYSSADVRQDAAGSYFKVTNVDILDNEEDENGHKIIEVTGEFSCKVREQYTAEKETLDITNAKFKFLYSAFGKEKEEK